MNQKIKYVGLLAILPLMKVALSPDLIGTANADQTRSTPRVAPEQPAPEVDLSLKILGEADAYESEEDISLTSSSLIELVSEDPSTTPIIRIIGIGQ